MIYIAIIFAYPSAAFEIGDIFMVKQSTTKDYYEIVPRKGVIEDIKVQNTLIHKDRLKFYQDYPELFL